MLLLILGSFVHVITFNHTTIRTTRSPKPYYLLHSRVTDHEKPKIPIILFMHALHSPTARCSYIKLIKDDQIEIEVDGPFVFWDFVGIYYLTQSWNTLKRFRCN